MGPSSVPNMEAKAILLKIKSNYVIAYSSGFPSHSEKKNPKFYSDLNCSIKSAFIYIHTPPPTLFSNFMTSSYYTHPDLPCSFCLLWIPRPCHICFFLMVFDFMLLLMDGSSLNYPCELFPHFFHTFAPPSSS